MFLSAEGCRLRHCSICLPFAIGAGLGAARAMSFNLKFLIEALLQMPMVLPPVVLGYLLLVLFGSNGWIGKLLNEWGIQLAFNWKGAVLASSDCVISADCAADPFVFQMINQQLEQVAGSLGAHPLRVFASISLPLALPGI